MSGRDTATLHGLAQGYAVPDSARAVNRLACSYLDLFKFVARVADLDPSLGLMDTSQLVTDARDLYWKAVR